MTNIRYQFPYLLIFCLVVLLGIAAYVTIIHDMRSSTHGFNVLCTTTMLADAVHAIAGNTVNINTLMGPGIDPHTYRAREGDVHRIASADAVLYHGLHLEGKLTELLEGMNRYVPTLAATEHINMAYLRESEFSGIYDPHVWHDVGLWKEAVKAIENFLIQHNPMHADYYRANTERYCTELDLLDTWIHQQINHVPLHKRTLVTAHDAFYYFGKAYGVHIVALQGISTDCDVGTKDIVDLVTYMIEHSISIVFVESALSARALHAVQQTSAYYQWPIILGETLYADSLGNASSKADTYIRMMQYNVAAIISGFNHDQ
jgi:manganese/zinc/iron transport system substrate-binding protein